MSQPSVSLATLAPPPPPPGKVATPPLPDLPVHLRNGGPGVARLPAASGKVAAIPRRYLLTVAIPLAITVLLTLAVPFTPWPAPQSLGQPARSTYPMPMQTAPNGRGGRVRPPTQPRRGTQHSRSVAPTGVPAPAVKAPSPGKVDQIR